MEKIKTTSALYSFSPSEEGPSCTNKASRLIESRIYVEDDHEVLVGIDSFLEEILGKLVEGTSSRAMISLVGFGGAGKKNCGEKSLQR